MNVLNINNAKFETTAVKSSQYPVSHVPEVAFVGRSNVGKSSVINTLLNRKNLARTGSTPGKTRVINFYNIDEKLHFVDLPGYGYANVSKKEIASWSSMIETYLNSREQLSLILMLVDIRHKPSENDIIMHEWIKECSVKERNIPYIIVATKSDKISKSQVVRQLNQVRTTLCVDKNVPIIPISSITKQGSENIWEHIKNTIF